MKIKPAILKNGKPGYFINFESEDESEEFKKEITDYIENNSYNYNCKEKVQLLKKLLNRINEKSAVLFDNEIIVIIQDFLLSINKSNYYSQKGH